MVNAISAPVAMSTIRARSQLPPPAERRAIRRRVGATQTEVGALVGVCEQTISNYEAGSRSPRGENLIRYVRVPDELRNLA